MKKPFDPKRDSKCPRCGLLLSVCPCDTQVDLNSETYRAFLSVETHGGADDVVTLIEKLPASEPYLKTMIRKMASDCQIRGTFRLEGKQGVIEILGDKRIKLRGFFEKIKIPFVG